VRDAIEKTTSLPPSSFTRNSGKKVEGGDATKSVPHHWWLRTDLTESYFKKPHQKSEGSSRKKTGYQSEIGGKANLIQEPFRWTKSTGTQDSRNHKKGMEFMTKAHGKRSTLGKQTPDSLGLRQKERKSGGK